MFLPRKPWHFHGNRLISWVLSHDAAVGPRMMDHVTQWEATSALLGCATHIAVSSFWYIFLPRAFDKASLSQPHNAMGEGEAQPLLRAWLCWGPVHTPTKDWKWRDRETERRQKKILLLNEGFLKKNCNFRTHSYPRLSAPHSRPLLPRLLHLCSPSPPPATPIKIEYVWKLA